jgi:hypothetical protein
VLVIFGAALLTLSVVLVLDRAVGLRRAVGR